MCCWRWRGKQCRRRAMMTRSAPGAGGCCPGESPLHSCKGGKPRLCPGDGSGVAYEMGACVCVEIAALLFILKKQNVSIFKSQSISRNPLFLNITSQIPHSFLLLEFEWNWCVFLILKKKKRCPSGLEIPGMGFLFPFPFFATPSPATWATPGRAPRVGSQENI